MNMKKKHTEQFAATYLEDFAYKQKMSATTSLVFDALLFHCKIIQLDASYRVRQTKFVSQQKIAAMIGKSERTVSKAINALKKIPSGYLHQDQSISLLQVKKNQYGNATYTIVTNKQNVPNTSCTDAKNDVLEQEGFVVPTRTHDDVYEQEHMSASIYKQNNNKNNKILTKQKNIKLSILNESDIPNF